MKRKFTVVFLLSVVVITLASIKINQVDAVTTRHVESKESVKKESIYSTNKTVQALVKNLKDYDQDYINQYLSQPDNERIIAVPGGGFASSTNPANHIINITENGKSIALDLNGKDAATVGEVKEVLKEVKALGK